MLLWLANMGLAGGGTVVSFPTPILKMAPPPQVSIALDFNDPQAALRIMNDTLQKYQQWLTREVYPRIKPGPFPNQAYTVATLPDATNWAWSSIIVTDETGGATIAFSDGSVWRRATDLTQVS